MTQMADLLLHSRKPGLETAIRFAKIALILIGAASTIFLAVRLAAPYCVNLLSSLPGIWVAAQIIIVAVWKLSENRPHEDKRPGEDKPPDAPPPVVEERDDEDASAVLLDRRPSSEIWDGIPSSPPDPDSTTPAPALKSGEPPSERFFEASCLPTEDKKSMASTLLEIKESMNLPSPNKQEEEDSMDKTWRAILDEGATPVRRFLRKSDTWERSPRVDARARARAPSRPELRKSATFREAATEKGWRGMEALVVGRDELFGRVEAFINMHYDHLRLQRQESEQRQFTEMFNHSY